MNCPNCGTPAEPGAQFCLPCGFDLTTVTAANASLDAGTTTPAVATATPVAAGTLVVALKYNNQEFPLYDGSSLIIARDDSDKCQPNIAIASDRVSSAPVEIKAENGKATVNVDPRGVTIRVTKLVRPGESIGLEPGEMMMLGDQIITVG